LHLKYFYTMPYLRMLIVMYLCLSKAYATNIKGIKIQNCHLTVLNHTESDDDMGDEEVKNNNFLYLEEIPDDLFYVKDSSPDFYESLELCPQKDLSIDLSGIISLSGIIKTDNMELKAIEKKIILSDEKLKPFSLLNYEDFCAQIDTDSEEYNDDILLQSLNSKQFEEQQQDLKQANLGAPKPIERLNTSRADELKKQKKSLERQNFVKSKNFVKNESEINPFKLAQDAKIILEGELNSWTKSSTVIFCVVLRNKYGYCKKFVFHNGPNKLKKNMRDRAYHLNYEVIQANQSHSEIQFVQFLYKRHKIRPGFYTHILGMGCSKKHCKECNCLMELLLIPNYCDITASIDDSLEVNSTDRKIEQLPCDFKRYGNKVSYTEHVRVEFTLAEGAEAVSKDIYPNYYLSEEMATIISKCVSKEKLGDKVIKFGRRFKKENADDDPKKRKLN
jgi:hypothetical protein